MHFHEVGARRRHRRHLRRLPGRWRRSASTTSCARRCPSGRGFVPRGARPAAAAGAGDAGDPARGRRAAGAARAARRARDADRRRARRRARLPLRAVPGPHAARGRLRRRDARPGGGAERRARRARRPRGGRPRPATCCWSRRTSTTSRRSSSRTRRRRPPRPARSTSGRRAAQMKKGRPGIVLSALARPADAEAVAGALLRHTSALGVRLAPYARRELDRDWVTSTPAARCGSSAAGWTASSSTSRPSTTTARPSRAARAGPSRRSGRAALTAAGALGHEHPHPEGDGHGHDHR